MMKSDRTRLAAPALGLVLLATLALGTAPASAQRSPFPAPTGYWGFDSCSGATAWDSAVTPHHGAFYNGPGCNTFGRYGGSASFDGIDDRYEIPYSSDFALGNQLSVAAWIYPTRLIGTQTIVNQWYGNDAWMLLLTGNSLSFNVVLPGGGKSVSWPITANTWTHVAGTYNGTTLRLYVNGVERASIAASGTVAASSRPIVVGSNPAWNAYQGYIDEVKLYKTGLDAGQVGSLATNPVATDTRGLHLLPSSYVCDPAVYGTSCRSSTWNQFKKDLDYIHSIGNLNSVKSTVFSFRNDPNTALWLDRQNQKLSWLASAAGNHVTYVFRAYPVMCENGQACDCPKAANGTRDYYACGVNFSQNLVTPFNHIKNTLHLRDVYMEVGNEPNIVGEGFVDAAGNPSSAAYNDFFRGFYFGQQGIGYNFPLTYAGLSPGCTPAGSCTSEAWYQDFWVRDHMTRYAAKIGVHLYWNSLTATQNSAGRSGRSVEQGGLFYRRVKNLLNGAVPQKGLQITEFNLNRASIATTEQQAADFCLWWKQEKADAATYWTDQAFLFITDTEDPSDNGVDDRPFRNEYTMADDQLDNIRLCQ